MDGPYSWTQVKDACTPPLKRMVREPAVEDRYKAYLKTAEAKRFVDSLFADGRSTTFVFNEFPYWMGAGVVHGCVWSKEPIDQAWLQGRLQALQRTLPVESCFFENLPKWKSMPEVDHVHVFFKCPGEERQKLLEQLNLILG